jgi:very-short-patch-repair endonuclease
MRASTATARGTNPPLGGGKPTSAESRPSRSHVLPVSDRARGDGAARPLLDDSKSAGRAAIDSRVAEMAARQHGVVTRVQMLAAGCSGSAIDRRLEDGRIRRLHRGVYRVGPVMAAHAHEAAAVLACGPHALLSHLSAIAIWDPPPGRDRRRVAAGRPPGDEVDVTVVGGQRRSRPGIRVHTVRRLDADERTIHAGLPITTPARTLLDLAGVVGPRELERAVARAEREHLVDRATLESLLDGHRGRVGTGALRAVLNREGGPALTRSEAEADFLELVRRAGLRAPRVNVNVGPYEVDFLWKPEGVAVEVDGFRHHASRPGFEGDRRKDAWLLGQGIQVIRVTWRQIQREPLATVTHVAQVLARVRAVGQLHRGR